MPGPTPPPTSSLGIRFLRAPCLSARRRRATRTIRNFLRVDTAPFNLAAGSVFTWTVTVQATNAQQIVNAANANGDTPDPNTANNVGWATNNAVNPAADLSVTKTARQKQYCS